MIKPWVAKWLGIYDPLKKLRVADEYRRMAALPLALADLCSRNFIYAPAPDAADLFRAGIVEGRRRAVLEILDMARVSPHELGYGVTVREPKQGGDDAD